MMTIKFNQSSKDKFFNQLKKKVNHSLQKEGLLRKAKTMLWLKLIFYSFLFISAYCMMLYSQVSQFSSLLFFYVSIGLSGILLAFNAAHDAAHSTFSRKAWVNDLIYHLTFNLQGVNAYLWKIRHISSHHVFPNVDGCDADIDDNSLIKLSPSHESKSFHKYQHLYATILYCFYTLHWIFFKDFAYLTKKNIANLKNLNHPSSKIIALFAWKVFYLFYMMAIPVYFGYPFKDVLLAFVLMHFVVSLFFVWSLIISHFTMETQFPVVNDQGVLPFNYARHQLSVSMDYYPSNRLASWIFGGFNSHAAHHLFPNIPHTTYPELSLIIKEVALEHNYPYNELSIPEAIISHYRFLKKIGSIQKKQFNILNA